MPQTKFAKRKSAIERLQSDLDSMKLYFLSINANKNPKEKEFVRYQIIRKEVHIEKAKKNLTLTDAMSR
jgi:hypothetical protein